MNKQYGGRTEQSPIVRVSHGAKDNKGGYKPRIGITVNSDHLAEL